MKKICFLLMATFVCYLSAGAFSINDEWETPPIQIQLGPNKEGGINREIVNNLLDCWYYRSTKSFLFSSFSVITNVEITIQNITTGELVREEYPVFASHVNVPVTGNKGLYIIEVVVNDTDKYMGVVNL